MKAWRFGSRAESRYRMIPQAQILEMMLLGGWAFELDAGLRDDAERAATRALEGWIALGLAYRTGDAGERSFDPAEVFNGMKSAALRGEDDVWPRHFVATGRRLASTLQASADASELAFDVRLERRFDMRDALPGSVLRLRLPLPLEGAYLSELRVAPLVRAESGADMRVNVGRLDVRLPVPADRTVTIGAEVRFTARADTGGKSRASLGGEERALYLRPVEGTVRVTTRVADLARKLCGDARGLDAVMCFWNYLLDEFACGILHYDLIDAHAPLDWLLDEGWYDCNLGAALLVALCRARDIPARVVGGHVLFALAPTNHYWAEVWIEGRGWLPFDLLAWDLSEGGRDVSWRERYAQRVDQRMQTECFPRDVVGTAGVRLPAAFQMLQTRYERGVQIAFIEVATSRAVYVDRVTIEREAPETI